MRNTATSDRPPATAAPIRPADAAAIAEAAALVRAGALVAFATETVYGLGANAGDARAVARIFAAKGRPRFNPLIVHVASLAAARRIGRIDGDAERLAAAFWPGPLTLVVPRRPRSGIADLVTAGIDTIALRVPSAPGARALIEAAGVPLAAPSANRSGHVSATTAAHAAADLGGAVAMVLDDGPAAHGIESTIVGVLPGEPVRLLRAGAVARDEVEAVLGRPLAAPVRGEVRAPGQLGRHYAPRARLRLDAREVRPGEVLVAFGPPPAGTAPAFSLSPSGDLVEAAANLFAVLRALDASGARAAAVMPVPSVGLGEAINDRLARAAAPPDADGAPAP